MTGAVRVAATVATRGVRLNVTLAAGRTTALVGPNGAGKSTLIQLVSGQLRPDEGVVEIGGEVVSDARVHVPPHRRTVALLEQRPLLFPHLNVLDNVAFGVHARGATKAASRRRARAELDAVGAAAFASRRVDELSGGQAQRVALARALATDPSVVLLDEPFAALDVATAAEMRALLASRLGASATSAVLVTHDPLDVWSLADDVVALEAGRVTAAGPVATVLGRPPTPFLAQFTGVNLLAGSSRDDGIDVADHLVSGLWEAASRPGQPHQPAMATFPPTAVALFRDVRPGSPRNLWPVTVTGFEPRGAIVRVLLQLGDQPLSADLTAQGAAALSLAVGDRVFAQVKATQVMLYGR